MPVAALCIEAGIMVSSVIFSESEPQRSKLAGFVKSNLGHVIMIKTKTCILCLNCHLAIMKRYT